MKNNLLSRSLMSLMAVVMCASVMAQAPVRVNKAVMAQQKGSKTVLLSTDSRMPQVLATFDQPTDVNALPQEVKYFLANYETALQQIAKGAQPSSVLSVGNFASDYPDSVAPVLGNINFNQGTPYNDRCPVINGYKAVTGCVATAMAMVMAHYKYPSVGTGEVTYTGTGGAAIYKYADHPFDWDNMLDTYDGVSYTGKEAAAVAELSLACGAAIQMDYSASGSGTQAELAKTALQKYFGYSSDIAWGVRPDDTEWLDLDWYPTMQEQFINGHPVIYAATGPGGANGHCFCIDGYVVKPKGIYFHVNWGWGGSGNGWFMLTSLAEGSNNYNTNQRMIYNIYPKGAAIENTGAESKSLDMSQPIYNILGARVNAEALQHGQIYLQKGRKFVY